MISVAHISYLFVRWGYDTRLAHGGFYCGPDRYNPGTLQEHKWENAMTVDTVSWGVRRDIHLRAILTMDELLGTVIETVSCGGNMLINVGPTKEGNILPIFQERLRSLGDWLKVNLYILSFASRGWEKKQHVFPIELRFLAHRNRRKKKAGVIHFL